MKKLALILLVLVGASLFMPLAASEGSGGVMPEMSGKSWGLMAAGITITFAAGLCGLAQSKAIAAACDGIARNPGAGGRLFLSMILGLVLIESLVLYCLLIAFNIIGVAKG